MFVEQIALLYFG